ncbi:hypothetical protein LCGC14_1592410 [marine sediment metagenome]|uniref:Uncharacterized protein n=1 Tax=marine sediment metagenome TaxID=412755 RepID=A0A0F9IDI6_9ZZZZ
MWLELFRAKQINTNPMFCDSKALERTFMSRVNALRWLSSFSTSRYNEFYIDGERVEDPRSELKKL